MYCQIVLTNKCILQCFATPRVGNFSLLAGFSEDVKVGTTPYIVHALAALVQHGQYLAWHSTRFTHA